MTAAPDYARQALRDLEQIGDTIAIDNPRRAISFVRDIREHCRRLAARPRMHRPRLEFGDGIRVAPHGATLIFYAERAEGLVVIERVLHGSRDLGPLLDPPD
ncbi:type II toxin-antitoxin system RelE/ParE family toxin [Paracraurococcus lichenis]|uniref:Type II toxin-antitoxin system RelE/ParE family toxin n=1 Tax=Paracraurococcus lichenis TaxID=3064888 RepID=A0ABT9DT07_9PROT|nr:type II toxin-antitoxin system RelE/ParE family toxin [Paracraurococcus sp. LOR1-02]MDO9707022.1 type II toxin-antitoxin system RelE/ParE family toxin [Paracraurococcus sp. LOR1-02]